MKWNAMVLGVVAMVACGGDKDTDTDTDTDTTDTDTDTDADTDTDTDADTDTDTDADTDTDTDADTDHTGHTGWTDTAAMMYDLTLDGTGYTPHDGQTIYFKIRSSTPPGFALAASDSMVMDATGEIHMVWHNVLSDGVGYVLTYFADMDGDGTCVTANDHAWLLPVNPDKRSVPRAVTSDQALVFDHQLPRVPQDQQACTLYEAP